MRILMIVLLVFSFGPAMAASREAVVGLLGGYEWHADKQALDALGPDTDKVLMAIAGDSHTTNLLRGRAIAALSLYPNDDVWQWFHAGIGKFGNELLRRRLVDAMCDAFLASRPASLEQQMEPLLGAADAHLRIRAAKCLRRTGGDRAAAALADYRRTITQPWELRAAGFKGANIP